LKQTNKHTPDPIANNVYELRNTGSLVHYLHKALFSPMKSAMLQAIKDGHLITWPGLTEDAINKHLRLTPVTAMGQTSGARTYDQPRRHHLRNNNHRTRLGRQDPPRVRSRCRPGSALHRLDGKILGAIQQRKLLCDGMSDL
jgi:hypothetical protein